MLTRKYLPYFIIIVLVGCSGGSVRENLKTSRGDIASKNCITTKKIVGKKFPKPKMQWSPEFGDNAEFFPYIQCMDSLEDYGIFYLSVVEFYIGKDGNLFLLLHTPDSQEKNPYDGRQNYIIAVYKRDKSFYKFKLAYLVESLGGIKGITGDEAGDIYFFTYRKETLDKVKTNYKQPWARKGVAAIVKIDNKTQTVAYSTNLLGDPSEKDPYEFKNIYSPLNFGTASLVYGDGKVLVLFAKNLHYDESIKQRHQNSLFAGVDAKTGKEFLAINGYSHSFDQFLTYDEASKKFIGLELGDAYSRAVGLSELKVENQKITKKTAQAYLIKGYTGDNNTFTVMGNLLVTTKGYLVLFGTVENGNSNLAMVRILSNLPKKESGTTNDNIDPSWKGEMVTIEQDRVTKTNKGVRWFTKFKEDDDHAVESCRMALLSDNSVLVIFFTSQDVQAFSIDLDGNYIKKPRVLDESVTQSIDYLLLKDSVPIFDKDGKSQGLGWVTIKTMETENESVSKFIIQYVDKNLKVNEIELVD